MGLGSCLKRNIFYGLHHKCMGTSKPFLFFVTDLRFSCCFFVCSAPTPPHRFVAMLSNQFLWQRDQFISIDRQSSGSPATIGQTNGPNVRGFRGSPLAPRTIERGVSPLPSRKRFGERYGCVREMVQVSPNQLTILFLPRHHSNAI